MLAYPVTVNALVHGRGGAFGGDRIRLAIPAKEWMMIGAKTR